MTSVRDLVVMCYRVVSCTPGEPAPTRAKDPRSALGTPDDNARHDQDGAVQVSAGVAPS